MKKRVTVFTLLIALVSVLMIENAFAADETVTTPSQASTGINYEENKFTNEECIEDTSWMSTATTNYELNKETGVYTLSGSKYSELSDEDKQSFNIVYDISDTGKTLYGYIPNYSTKIQDPEKKVALSNLEIITTSSCTNTLKVVKTVVGGSFDNDEEYMASQEYDDESIKAQEERNNQTYTDENTEQEYAEEVDVPNTASAISIITIVAGAALFTFGICLLLKPELIKKITNNNEKNTKKNIMSIFIVITLITTTIFPGTVINSKAEGNINKPQITEVEKSEIEDLALTVKWDSFNEGPDYTVELVNETTGLKNRFANTVKEFTYQGLEIGKNYKIKLRVCTSENEEDCSDWSEIKERNYDRSLRALVLNYKNVALLQNHAIQMEVIQYIPKGTTDDKTITWSTEDANIATVDENGLVTAKSQGETIVTATTNNGIVATCNVKVTDIAINLKSISIDKTLHLQKGKKSSPLKVTYQPADTTDSRKITWSSSNKTIATVDSNGIVYGVGAGTTTIIARTANGKTATCKVTVTTNRVAITKIALNKTKTTITKGNAETLKVTYTPANTTDAKKVTWSSNKTSVATVNSSGKVTAKAAGTAKITAKTANGKTASCTVTVKGTTSSSSSGGSSSSSGGSSSSGASRTNGQSYNTPCSTKNSVWYGKSGTSVSKKTWQSQCCSASEIKNGLCKASDNYGKVNNKSPKTKPTTSKEKMESSLRTKQKCEQKTTTKACYKYANNLGCYKKAVQCSGGKVQNKCGCKCPSGTTEKKGVCVSNSKKTSSTKKSSSNSSSRSSSRSSSNSSSRSSSNNSSRSSSRSSCKQRCTRIKVCTRRLFGICTWHQTTTQCQCK